MGAEVTFPLCPSAPIYQQKLDQGAQASGVHRNHFSKSSMNNVGFLNLYFTKTKFFLGPTKIYYYYFIKKNHFQWSQNCLCRLVTSLIDKDWLMITMHNKILRRKEFCGQFFWYVAVFKLLVFKISIFYRYIF